MKLWGTKKILDSCVKLPELALKYINGIITPGEYETERDELINAIKISIELLDCEQDKGMMEFMLICYMDHAEAIVKLDHLIILN
jgi:hypothetical protein